MSDRSLDEFLDASDDDSEGGDGSSEKEDSDDTTAVTGDVIDGDEIDDDDTDGDDIDSGETDGDDSARTADGLSARSDDAEEAVDRPDDGVSTPVPASSTYVWDVAGGVCEDCGETADRRWRRDGDLVCPDCKEW